jgi:uncharacterized protein YlxW (UPF0749 family)
MAGSVDLADRPHNDRSPRTAADDASVIVVRAEAKPGRRWRARLRNWRWLVPVICLAAGFMFATSADASRGTDLRSPDSANLVDLVQAAEAQIAQSSTQLGTLQNSVSGITNAAGRDNSAVATAQQLAAPLLAPAGLTAVTGPGIRVVLDDAHGTVPADVDPNQLVVHQSDLQAVVNALWGGGAEAMTVAGQRVIATSAVRCVGNTLLLNGRVFSPPFAVLAIGPFGTMHTAMDRSPGVNLFKQAASYYGLGYIVEQVSAIQLPAYTGPITLSYAKAVAR